MFVSQIAVSADFCKSAISELHDMSVFVPERRSDIEFVAKQLHSIADILAMLDSYVVPIAALAQTRQQAAEE